MPTLNQNVLINGKVVHKGKSISAANVKKLELGDHLFDQAEEKAPAKSSAKSEGSEEKSSDSDSQDQENQES